MRRYSRKTVSKKSKKFAILETINSYKNTLAIHLERSKYETSRRRSYAVEKIPFLVRLRNVVREDGQFRYFVTQDPFVAKALKFISRNARRKSVRKTAQEAYLLLVA